MKPLVFLVVVLAMAIVVLCAIGVHESGRIDALEKRVADLEPIEPSWSNDEQPPIPPPEGAVGIPTGVYEEGIAGDGTVLYRQEFMRYPELEGKR